MIFSRSPSKRRVQIRTALWTTIVVSLLTAAPFVSNALINRDAAAPADFYGHPVTLSSAPHGAAHHFDVRTGCRITRFGVASWRFSRETKDEQWSTMTYQAMRAAGLPEGAAAKAVAAMRAGKPDETLGMGDAFGQAHTSGMYFLSRYDTSYRTGNRYTACLDSATRFGNDRQESATVYRIAHDGQVYFVGEFLACGNVTRFYPAAPTWTPGVTPAVPGPVGTPQAPGAIYPLPGPGLPHGGRPGKPTRPSQVVAVNETPEPGTLALFGAAVAGLVLSRWRK